MLLLLALWSAHLSSTPARVGGLPFKKIRLDYDLYSANGSTEDGGQTEPSLSMPREVLDAIRRPRRLTAGPGRSRSCAPRQRNQRKLRRGRFELGARRCRMCADPELWGRVRGTRPRRILAPALRSTLANEYQELRATRWVYFSQTMFFTEQPPLAALGLATHQAARKAAEPPFELHLDWDRWPVRCVDH